MKSFLLMLFLAATSSAVAQDVPEVSSLQPEEEAAALSSAEATGLAIHRHDRAAAAASDAALKLRVFKRDKRVRGWITEEKGGVIAVTFLDQTPAALYRANVSSSGAVIGDVSVLDTATPLTEYEAGAATARATALAMPFQRCAERYNTVVLPLGVEQPDAWAVYLLPATTKHNVVPVGGTHRVDTTGTTVTSQRGFTRSCIALQNDPRTAGLLITHLLDPIPTEAHVFWSAWAGKPMYVATPPGTLWSIENGKIRLVKRAGDDSEDGTD